MPRAVGSTDGARGGSAGETGDLWSRWISLGRLDLNDQALSFQVGSMRLFVSLGVLLLFPVLCWAQNPFRSSQPGYPDWSPFEEVKWEQEQPLVRVNGKWFTPLSIHGIPVDKILRHSSEQGWRTKVRFAEDTVQMIRLMGGKIDKKTDLVLVDEEGREVTLTDFVMVARRNRPPNADRVAELSREELSEDLTAFRQGLEQRFAYLKANDYDYLAAIAKIDSEHPKGIKTSVLAEQLHRVMMGFIDGHASVSGFRGIGAGAGRLPLQLDDDGERIVATRSDRTALIDADHPYLVAIDGVSIEEWIAKTEPWIARGSEQMLRRRGLGILRDLAALHDKEEVESVEIELVSRDKKSTTRIRSSLVAAAERPRKGWPTRPENGLHDNNIGYIHLPGMDRHAVEAIRKWMPQFRDAIGVIIDVRGNGGGIRTPILELASHLLSPEDEPRIGNVAKYRLAAGRDDDHLTRARYVHRADSSVFSERDRAAVKVFARAFSPEWEPPTAEFSAWHYLVLSKSAEDDRYHYEGPVLILMDTGCFSATDIFLSTFKGWPNVTLVGQPSGGGSARSESFRLPHSGISVRCASMASYQPTGMLYDGHGVQPDVVITQPPEHYLIGGPDLVLETARKAIAASR